MKQKFAFIDEHRSCCSVVLLCRALHVSRSAYYAYKDRKPSKRDRDNAGLLRALVQAHQKYPSMGLDSLFHFLRPSFGASRARIHRLMVKHNIHSSRRAVYKRTTNSNHSRPISPNLLQRDFDVPRPNQAWVGDITYIPTDEGWLYLATVQDLCTRKVVGHACSSRIDAALVCEAMQRALCRQAPDRGLIFHSDRGSQYSSSAYRLLLEQNGIRQSMSRRGDPYDNAVAENFFSCLKCELVSFRRFHTREDAELAIFRYIEGYYNTVRPHSGIGWMTPNAFEKQAWL